MNKFLFFIALLPVVSISFGQESTSTIKNNLTLTTDKQQPAANAPATFTVDGKIALHSLMSISDAHLQKLADGLKILATTDAARSANWERIRGPFAMIAQMNVPAVYWFARPDGSYWTLGQGRINSKLSDREYFPRLLSGKAVIGQLVVSRSTNRNTAIVAVPVFGKNKTVVGALGCSIHLDSLSALVREEMGVTGDGLFFYSFDSEPLVGLHADPAIIFIEPMKLEDQGLKQAFTEMLAGTEGVVEYMFRGVQRTVLYCKSSVTGWWYGFGKMER